MGPFYKCSVQRNSGTELKKRCWIYMLKGADVGTINLGLLGGEKKKWESKQGLPPTAKYRCQCCIILSVQLSLQGFWDSSQVHRAMAWAAEQCQDHQLKDNGAQACYPDSPADELGRAEPQNGTSVAAWQPHICGRTEGLWEGSGEALARAVGLGLFKNLKCPAIL